MDHQPIPDVENQAYQRKIENTRIATQILEDAGVDAATQQFMRDFSQLAFAITEPDWHKPLPPHGIDGLPPFRTEPIPRKLPRGPLKRMARMLGIGPLRYLRLVGTDDYQDAYRLVLRQRLDKEYRRGNHYKAHRKGANLIRFGNEVLSLKEEGVPTLEKALETAASQLGYGASLRTLERRFRAFRNHCLKLRYVPSPSEWMGAPPKFSLDDLAW